MSIIAAGTTTTTALSSTGNTDGTLQLQVNGTTPSVTLNTLGAIGVGSTPSFGTAGQVLTSNGSTSAAYWSTSGSSQWTTSGSNIYYTTGSVAIGYTTPSAKLDVGGFSTSNLTTVALAITDAPSTANAGLQIAFRNSATTYTYASVGYSNEAGASAGALLFYTNSSIFTNTNAEKARITSAGRFGVGTTTPASKFVVANGSAEALEFNPTGGTAGGAYIQGYNRTSFVYTPVEVIASSFAIYPQGGASKVNVNFNGLGLGTGTPSSGIGITFPATQDPSSNANTLDDYEEGTWTPAYSFGNGTTGITYSTQSGGYIKVGAQVTIWAHILLSNKGSSTGQARITGLPFTNVNAAGRSEGATAVFNYWQNFATATSPLGYVQNNTTQIILTNYAAATSVGTVSDATFNNNSAVYFNCTYSTV